MMLFYKNVGKDLNSLVTSEVRERLFILCKPLGWRFSEFYFSSVPSVLLLNPLQNLGITIYCSLVVKRVIGSNLPYVRV